MSIVNKIIRQIPELQDSEDSPPVDRRYARKLSELAGSALQKNCDIMQLANGDVVVAEVKTVFYTYRWDDRKGKFLRSKNVRKRRQSDDFSDSDSDIDSDSDNDFPSEQHDASASSPARKPPVRRRQHEFAD